MIKRILKVFALLFIITLPTVSAENINLYKYGNMDLPICVFKAEMNGGNISWTKDGYSGGAAEVSVEKNERGPVFPIENPTDSGVYTLSFYLKLKDKNNTLFDLRYGSEKQSEIIMSANKAFDKWNKYSFELKYDKSSMQKKNNGFFLSFADDNEKYLIDEIKIETKCDAQAADMPEDFDYSYIDKMPKQRESELIRYADTQDHWAEPIISVLATNGFLNGFDNKRFCPDNSVTRAEFIKMIVSAEDGINGKNEFEDVTSGKWYYDAMLKAQGKGIIAPELVTDNKIYPEKAINREEAAAIAAMTLKKSNSYAENEFADSDEISEWAKKYVNIAEHEGLMFGDENGGFRPHDNVTRAEAAAILMRMAEKNKRLAFFVDPDTGKDNNSGSFDKPFATVYAAAEAAKKVSKSMDRNIYIMLKGTEHYMDKTLQLDESDSGENGYSIVYTSYGKTPARMTMGKHFSGFELYDKDKNIYRTYVGQGTDSRQVYINGVRAVRAKSDSGLKDATKEPEYGHTTTDLSFLNYKHIQDLEMVYYQVWTKSRCGVDHIKYEDGVVKMFMDQPGWYTVTGKGGTAVRLPSYYENAYELLDQPGEWYIDKYDGWLYYMPRSYEDMDSAVSTIPIGEKMIRIEGSEANNTAHHIEFRNIRFEYTGWMRPSTKYGHGDSQNNHIRERDENNVAIEDYLPDAAVYSSNVRYVNFIECTFAKMGITALQMVDTVQNCKVTGNEFYDISGNAMSIGRPLGAFDTVIKPKEYKNYIIYNNVENNYIHNIGIDYMSAAAISVGFPKFTSVSNNEILFAPYSGMHIGYGWDSYSTLGTATYSLNIEKNYIHEVMNDKVYDGGGIYTIGATGGMEANRNKISYNYFQNIRNNYGSIYLDEGSTYWEISNNVIDLKAIPYYIGAGDAHDLPRWCYLWTPTSRYCKVYNNYTTTPVRNYASTFSTFEEGKLYENADWPGEAQRIVDNAGMEEYYLEKYPVKLQWTQFEKYEHIVDIGEKRQVKIEGHGRKDELYDAYSTHITYRSMDENIAKVDDEGYITGIAPGETVIEAYVLLNDVIQTISTKVYVGDSIEDITNNQTNVSMMKGYTATITSIAKTEAGREMAIEKQSYSIDDTSIAKISNSGRVTGCKVGNTMAHGRYEVDGKVFQKDFVVRIIDYVNEDSDNIKGVSVDNKFFEPENWTAGAQKEGDGIKVSTPTDSTPGQAFYKEKIGDEFISFDMQINNPNSWPSITFNAQDTDKNYNSDTCYMIGFKSDIIEFQRFNEGKRTMIFGSKDFNPIGGSGIPNNGEIFEYGKKYHITIGTKNEEDGVRVVLMVDGKCVFDYLDTNNAIREKGYFGVYSRVGDFTFTPSKQEEHND